MINEKPKVLLSSNDGLNSPTTYVRVLFFLSQLQNDYDVFFIHDLSLVQSIEEYDIIIFARVTSKDGYRIAQMANQEKIPLIYDIDDYLWKLPSYSQSRQKSFYLDEILEKVQVVTTPSLEIDKLIKSKFPHIQTHLIFNAGDIQKDFTSFSVGVLSNSDFFRLPALRKSFFEGLAKTAEEHRKKILLYYFSNDLPEFQNDHPWLKIIWSGIRYFESYHEILHHIRPDFALIPLQEDHFNQYKSVIKFAEFARHKAIGIYSKVEPYSNYIQDGKNGFLAENSTQGWSEAFSRYLSLSLEEKMEMVLQNKKTQESNFSYKNMVLQWKTLLSNQISLSAHSQSKRSSVLSLEKSLVPIHIMDQRYFAENQNAYAYHWESLEILKYHSHSLKWLFRQIIKVLASRIKCTLQRVLKRKHPF